MKNSILALILLGALLGTGCSGSRFARSKEKDDVYFTKSDEIQEAPQAAAEQPYEAVEDQGQMNAGQQNQAAQYDDNRSSKYSSQSQYDPTVYEDDDFYYSRRVRRYMTGYSWSYWDPYYCYDPYFMIGTPYWGRYSYRNPWWYDPWYYSGPSFAWTYGWGYGGSFCSFGMGYYNPWSWYNPWPYSGWGYGGWGYGGWGYGGYGAGYYNGYWNGYYDGWYGHNGGWGNPWWNGSGGGGTASNVHYGPRNSMGSLRPTQQNNPFGASVQTASTENMGSYTRAYQQSPGSVPAGTTTYKPATRQANIQQGGTRPVYQGNTGDTRPANVGQGETRPQVNPQGGQTGGEVRPGQVKNEGRPAEAGQNVTRPVYRPGNTQPGNQGEQNTRPPQETRPRNQQQQYQTEPRPEYNPAPRQEVRPQPRQENNPAPQREEYNPPPRQEYQPAPRREESNPAPRRQEYSPAPRQEYNPPPRQESRPAPRESYNSSPRESYQHQNSGGNNRPSYNAAPSRSYSAPSPSPSHSSGPSQSRSMSRPR